MKKFSSLYLVVLFSLGYVEFLNSAVAPKANNKVVDKVDKLEVKNKKDNNMDSSKNNSQKIGFVNLHQIISADPKMVASAPQEWKDLFSEINKKMEPKNKEISGIEERYNKAKKEFEDMRQSNLAKEDALRKKYEEYATLDNEIRVKVQEGQREVQELFAAAQSQIVPKVDAVIAEIKKSHNFNLILNGAAVIIGDEQINITKDVISKLDEQYKETKKSVEQSSVNNKKAASSQTAPAVPTA